MTLYKLIVDQWKSANKGAAQATSPLVFAPDLAFYSSSRASLLQHPKLQGISAEAKKKILVFQLYNFLEFLLWAEQGPVTYVCDRLSSGGYPLQLSKDVLDGAAIIRGQEANHSIWAYRLMLGVEDVTNTVPFDLPPIFVRSMESVISRETGLEDLIQLMYVIIAEVIDLGTFETIRQDATVQEPVRHFAGDHEFEEKLHRVYFRRLFEEVWLGIPADLQQRIGLLLPEIVISLLGVDQEMTKLMLGAFPDQIPDPDSIIQDIVYAEKVGGSIRMTGLAVLRLMQSLGVLNNPTVAETFRIHNLMPDEFGTP